MAKRTQKPKKPTPDMPNDPKELARAIFRDADRKRTRRKKEVRRKT